MRIFRRVQKVNVNAEETMSFYAYFFTVTTPRLTADGFRYTSVIRADSKAQAERLVREKPLFRKALRQNGLDWRTAPLSVTRTSVTGKAR